MKELFKFTFLRTTPILFSYIFLGMAFGLLMLDAGYGIGWSALTSIIVYTGAFQLALVGLLKGMASYATIVITALAMGSRHIFYGFSFLEDFRKDKKKFPYLVFSLTDESYALHCSLDTPEGMNRQTIEFITSILLQSYWITGSILGGLIGSMLPFDYTGIDFCMTALFITIFIDQWIAFSKERKGIFLHIPAITGAVSSVFFLALLGPEDFLLPSMITTTAILIGLTGTKKYNLIKSEEKSNE